MFVAITNWPSSLPDTVETKNLEELPLQYLSLMSTIFLLTALNLFYLFVASKITKQIKKNKWIQFYNDTKITVIDEPGGNHKWSMITAMPCRR